MKLTSEEWKKVDMSTRLLYIIYDLAKIGVLKFDFNNPVHVSYFKAFVDRAGCFNEENYENADFRAKFAARNNNMLLKLILAPVLKGTAE